MRKYLLPENGNFYKANLHCHSTISDGRLTPEQIKHYYTNKGYSVVAYTDHDVMIPHHDLTDDHFLALTGYEMEVGEGFQSDFKHEKTCHMCFIALDKEKEQQVCYHRSKYLFANALNYVSQLKYDQNEPDYERSYTPECITDMMKKGRENRFFVTYNHPTWSLENYANYINYHGMHAMEICNFGCICMGHNDNNERVYDDMLRAGEKIYCIATDDNHNIEPDMESRRCDSFGGFTMIKADNLEYQTITDALVNGHFYASQKPEIHSLYFEDGMIHIKCSPADRIFMSSGTRHAKVIYDETDNGITESVFKCYADDGYVRITVVDKAGYYAATNAYFCDELFK